MLKSKCLSIFFKCHVQFWFAEYEQWLKYHWKEQSAKDGISLSVWKRTIIINLFWMYKLDWTFRLSTLKRNYLIAQKIFTSFLMSTKLALEYLMSRKLGIFWNQAFSPICVISWCSLMHWNSSLCMSGSFWLSSFI